MLLLICITALVYLPSVDGEFVFDDEVLIRNNPDIQNPYFLKEFLFSPFGVMSGAVGQASDPSGTMPFYRPLSMLFFWLDYNLWGLDPFGYHITNIVLHLINVAVLFLILTKLGLDHAGAFFGALLFSVFPPHFENISWISGRTDVISFLFASVSALYFIQFIKQRSYSFVALSALFYLLSLLSKESNILLILVAALVLLRKTRSLASFAGSILPFAACLAAWYMLRYNALGSASVETSGRSVLDFFSILGFYCIRTVFPFCLSVTINSAQVFDNPWYLAAGIAISSLFLFSAVYLLKKRFSASGAPFLVFSFCAALAPSMMVVFSASALSYVAWRFVYMASAFFTSYLVYLLFNKTRIRTVSILFSLLIAFAYSCEIWGKNGLYGRPSSEFWLNIDDVKSESILVQYNVGMALLKKDENKGLEILNSILSKEDHPLYEYSKRLVLESLGTLYTEKKNFNKAGNYFDLLMSSGDQHTQSTYFQYANYLGLSGNREQGDGIVSQMLARFPNNHLVLLNSAKYYLAVKEHKKAKELLEQDYKLFPNSKTAEMLSAID